MTEECLLAGIGLVERGDVLAGHDEDVHGSFGVDVCECVGVLVLMNGGGRNLAFDDLAEDAAHTRTVYMAGELDRKGCKAIDGKKKLGLP